MLRNYKPVIIFLYLATQIRSTFLLNSHSLPLLDVFLLTLVFVHSSFPSIGKFRSNCLFPLTFLQAQKGIFFFIFVINWEMFHDSISLNLEFLWLLLNFASGTRSELMNISFIVNIRSKLIHLHCFNAIAYRNHFFVYTNRINLPHQEWSSGRLLIITNRFLKLPNLVMLIKQNKRVYHFPETWLSRHLANW